MRLNIRILNILFLTNSLTFGQNDKESFWKPYIESDIQKLNLVSFDSIKHEKIYRIWKSYQVVELVVTNDSNYCGLLVNFVTKVSRKEKKNKIISQKLLIPDYTVKKLINKLSQESIEIMPDSYDVKGYINGLDGTTYVFEIWTRKGNRIYSYWEPENDYYQDPELSEVIIVRNILKAIKTEIDMNRLFSMFKENLDLGTYQYGGIIMTKFK